MKKSTKGALAAAASASLLLGGAGSLAYWNTTDDVTAGTFNTGSLVLDGKNCDDAGWKVTNTLENKNLVAVDLATFKAVPGDVLTKDCTVTVVATGDNLRADLAVTNLTQTASAAPVAGSTVSPYPTANPAAVAGLGNDYVIEPSFTIGGQPITTVRSTDVNKTITVKLTVKFPIGSSASNVSQLDMLTLNDYALVATQATATAAP